MIRAVVFDLGQVLASGEEVHSAPARELGVDPALFAQLYAVGRAAYDDGGSDAAYWGPILTGLGKPVTPETVQRLAARDADLWLRLRPTARQLLADVRAAGRLVAVLTNAPYALDHALVDAEFADEADHWFVSSAMGIVKPHPAVYRRVTEVLELPPDEVAFVDDLQPHVDAATAAGWHAYRWVSDADTRAWLVGLGVLAG